MKLTKRQADAVLRAAERIARELNHFSCLALYESHASEDTVQVYKRWISPRKRSEIDAMDFDKDLNSRGHRVMALLMFREVFR